jgi:hypothetical protein
MLPTNTLTGTRVPLMHGTPWWIAGSITIRSRQFIMDMLASLGVFTLFERLSSKERFL